MESSGRLVLLFDFDGTVADTLSLTLAIANRLLAEHQFRPIQAHEVDALRSFTWQEVRRHLGVPMSKVPMLMMRGRQLIRESQTPVQPFPGMIEALRQLRQDGHTLGIVTSDSEENVRRFLRVNQVEVFDFIDGSTTLWGKGRKLSTLIRRYGRPHRDFVYIGDEIRDIQAARKAEIRSIAVTWGFNVPQSLESSGPDFLVHAPCELLAAVVAASRAPGG